MEYTIPEMLTSRKAQDIGLIIAIILLGAVAFGLGRLSALSASKIPVTLCTGQEGMVQAVTGAVAGASVEESTGVAKGNYVASKSGSSYHYPWCSGAQRIKEENRVWFATKEEAETAGYRPASNCKGL